MSKIKKSVKLGLPFLALLGSLTGCGSTGSGSNSNASSPKGPETLNLWMLNAASTPEVQKLASEWNKTHPNVQIKVTAVTKDTNAYFSKVSTAMASGSGPDILYMSAGDLPQYVSSGIAYPVDQWLDKNKDDYYPNVLQSVELNGKMYAFPKTLQLMALYYNKTMFQKAGLQPPQTWDQMLSDAKKLTTKNVYGLRVETAEGPYGNFEFYPFVWMQGGNIISNDGKSVVVDQSTANALQLYRNIMQSGVANKKLQTGGFDLTSFGQGKYAMALSGSWAVPMLDQKFPKLDYGVVPYPVPKAGMKSSSDAGGWMWIVNSRSKDPVGAGNFMDWMTNGTPDRYVPWLKAEDNWPPRKSVLKAAGSFYETGHNKVFSDQILPIAGMEPEWNAGVVKAVGDAIQAAEFTNQPISDIVAKLKQDCQSALASN